MKINVNEITNWFYSDYKDELVAVHVLQGDTLEDCFYQMYALRRSGRYDNDRRYEFQDTGLEEKYYDWKSTHETIEMYYGGGVVD